LVRGLRSGLGFSHAGLKVGTAGVGAATTGTTGSVASVGVLATAADKAQFTYPPAEVQRHRPKQSQARTRRLWTSWCWDEQVGM
jgi:hypothetical protein